MSKNTFEITRLSGEIETRWKNRGKIPVWRVFLLMQMASENIYPDGTFSDAEISIWEELQRLMASNTGSGTAANF